mgnify:CR=1 FL=1
MHLCFYIKRLFLISLFILSLFVCLFVCFLYNALVTFVSDFCYPIRCSIEFLCMKVLKNNTQENDGKHNEKDGMFNLSNFDYACSLPSFHT